MVGAWRFPESMIDYCPRWRTNHLSPKCWWMVNGQRTVCGSLRRRKRLAAWCCCGCVGGCLRMVGLLRVRIRWTIGLKMVGMFELRLDILEKAGILLKQWKTILIRLWCWLWAGLRLRCWSQLWIWWLWLESWFLGLDIWWNSDKILKQWIRLLLPEWRCKVFPICIVVR